LGNSNLVQNNVLIDTWSGKLGTPGPRTPKPLGASGLNPVRLTLSPFVSDTSIMSSQFQITTVTGNYASPLVNVLRDWENVYGVTGGTIPVDRNAGIDLSRYAAASLSSATTYYWRARYRDQFMKWSAWSQEQSFRPAAAANSADFTADSLNVNIGTTVRFSDLSTNAPTGWEWDLDGNGSVDRTMQDPAWVYTQPGQYTVTLTTLYGTSRVPVTKTAYINVQSVTRIFGARPNLATLNQARFFPDPFRGSTLLKLDLRVAEAVRIDLYTVRGKHVRTLSDGFKRPGLTYVTWDGKDGAGRALPSGKYFYQIKSNSIQKTLGIILLR
jgi:PKD repeat protein